MHTGTRRFALGILILIVALALGAAVILAFVIPHKATAPAAGAGMATYHSATYGYAFSYPAQYSVQEYSPENVAVGTPNDGGGIDAVANADLVTATAEDGYGSFDDFIQSVAMNDCAADGPDESIRCTGVDHSVAYRSPSGVPGEEFFLTQVTTGGAGTSTAIRGPFYAFDITPNSTAFQFSALLVHVPAAGDDSATAPIVSGIADSLKINAVAQPGNDATGQSCSADGQSGPVCPAGYRCAIDTTVSPTGSCQPN